MAQTEKKRGMKMTAQKIFDIMSSSLKEDWLNLEEHELFVYKDDVHLRIQKRHVDYSEKFEGEEWAINHPCPDAYRVYYDVYYGASLIMTKILVGVDGGRAILPMPRIRTTEIPIEDYRFAKIVSGDSLDEYITRSKLTVAAG